MNEELLKLSKEYNISYGKLIQDLDMYLTMYDDIYEAMEALKLSYSNK